VFADFNWHHRLSDKSPLSKPITLGASDTLKIILTATEDGKAKRPHQAFLLLTDEETGLETSFPLSMKDNGKGKVDLVRPSNSVHNQPS
jgi:oligosaccharyltransferase complex subunit delta (ribophorin II)